MVKISRIVLAGAVVGVCLLPQAARATIQSILLSNVPSGPNTIYTYELVVTPNNGLQGGSIDPSALVMLDFPGVVSESISSESGDLTSVGDWTLSAPTTGASGLPDSSFAGSTFTLGGFAGNITGSDSATTNIVLQYTGADLAVNSSIFNEALLHLTITSSANSFDPLQTLSRNTAIGGINNEVDSFPILSQNSGAGTPEPASLSLLGLGAVALLSRRRK